MQTFLTRSVATLTLSLLTFGTAFAQQAPAADKPYSFILGAGITAGGDTLVSGTYTNGSTFTIKAGGGLDLKAGFEYRLPNKLALQGTVGYQSNSTSASNGNISFKRVPIELLALYEVNDKIRLGGGIHKSTGAAISSSGVATSTVGSTNFNSNTGTLIQGDYFVAKKDALSLRFVNESFTPTTGTTKLSGKHIGFYYFHYF